MNSNPNVYIIAGPNGAGKTTFAKEFLPSYAKCKNFVNADLIAQGLAPFAPELAGIKAGRILLEQIHSLSTQRADFAFESTLSGKSYLPFFKNLKAKGYTIHIFFLWIPDVNLALGRIKGRVAEGGHDVPAQDVKRRFKRSFNNFSNIYKIIADYWSIIDNSVIPPDVIVRNQGKNLEILDQELYNKIIQKKG